MKNALRHKRPDAPQRRNHGQERWVEYSAEFLELVRRHCTEEQSLICRRALAAWLYGYPAWYAHYIWSASGLQPLSASSLRVRSEEFRKALRTFRDRKDTKSAFGFLLNSTRALIPEHRTRANMRTVRFPRRMFGGTGRYFDLFRLVNTAALHAHDWDDFRHRYRDAFLALLHADATLKKLADKTGAALARMLGTRKSVVFVDSGMQGTFVLFLAECLRMKRKNVKDTVRIFCVYPWLAHLFGERAATDDARMIFALEQTQSRIPYDLDPLQKTSGALAGFAVGDALGFPAAGIEGNDFLAMHGGPITGLTVLSNHPMFTRLGDHTDNTRHLMGATHDLVYAGKYDEALRVEQLKRWTLACETKKGFARLPGRTTIAAGLKLVQGKSAKESGSRTTESCGATYRVIPYGLYYSDPSDIIRAAEQECAITHHTPLAIAGGVFVALFISFLRDDIPPKTAALQALRYTKSHYGRSIRALTRPLTRAIRGRVHIGDARMVFGTSIRIWETLPLAVFYFLQYPTVFRTAVLLGANAYRHDIPEDHEHLKGHSWAEQILQTFGGNTDGIAALVGAFLGAYNGIHVIDGEFYGVEDFEKLCGLGEKLELRRRGFLAKKKHL